MKIGGRSDAVLPKYNEFSFECVDFLILVVLVILSVQAIIKFIEIVGAGFDCFKSGVGACRKI